MIGFYLNTTGHRHHLIVCKTPTGFDWTIPDDWARDCDGNFGILLPHGYFAIGSLAPKDPFFFGYHRRLRKIIIPLNRKDCLYV